MSDNVTVNNCAHHTQIVGGPDLSTLSNRMCYAAAVLAEATRRYHGSDGRDVDYTDWRPVNLRYVATLIDREDAEAAEREAQIDALAREMFDQWGRYMLGDWDTVSDVCRVKYHDVAERLIDSGWSKSKTTPTAQPSKENN